jgi:hypothetical protein
LRVSWGDAALEPPGWSSARGSWVAWRFPEPRVVAALLVAGPLAPLQGSGFQLAAWDAARGGFVDVPARLQGWQDARPSAGEAQSGCLAVLPAAQRAAEVWQLAWETPGGGGPAAPGHLGAAHVLSHLAVNPMPCRAGPPLPPPPPPLAAPLTVGVSTSELRATLLLDAGGPGPAGSGDAGGAADHAAPLEAAVLRLQDMEAAAHVWPAAAALRARGALSLDVGDASCLATQPLLEPCAVALDVQHCCARQSPGAGDLGQGDPALPAQQALVRGRSGPLTAEASGCSRVCERA